MTKFGLEDRTTQSMVLEAVQLALNDAGLGLNQIDAAVISTVDTKVNDERQRHYPPLLSSLLQRKMPVIRVPAVCGGGGAAFWAALRLKYNNILVLGVDKVLLCFIVLRSVLNPACNVAAARQKRIRNA